MQSFSRHAPPGLAEFIALMAMLTSLTALAIDAMLPALAEIDAALQAGGENQRQLVIVVLFLGLAIAQIFYGPLSDRFGRRPPIFVGLAIFSGGCLLSAFATDFTTMLVGRFLQGVGSAGPRIVTMALVRDQYSGAAMARIMSLIMAVFIIVPTLAPAIGQGILLVAPWRAIFAVLLAVALLALCWFALRQPETLAPERRRPLAPGALLGAFLEVLTHRVAAGYTVAAGLVFGSFLGFLVSAQQILQEQYRLGNRFALYFAVLALALGAASYGNSRLVVRLGMRPLTRAALATLILLSALLLPVSLSMAGQPPLWSLMLFLAVTFAAIGVLLGNLNALAMEPMGHIAGTASAVIGSLTSLLSLSFGTLIGQHYDGTIVPLLTGFLLLSLASAAVVSWVERRR